jgi:hypothetical protein
MGKPVAHFGKNVVRLEQMVKSENPDVAMLAAIVPRVAWVKPYRTRRLKFIAKGTRNCCENWKTRVWFLVADGPRRLRNAPARRIRKEQNSLSERTLRQPTCLSKMIGQYRFEHN